MILLDVGVWLAAVWGRHARHTQVRSWFDEQERAMAFCRVTQMSLLRLLSNPSIMGDDVLTRADCWKIVDQLLSDDRVTHVEEPPQVELIWRALSARDDRSHKLWTDDYLAGFAQSSGLAIATLDRAFAVRYPAVRTELVT